MGFYESLYEILGEDAGGRGLQLPMPDLAAVAQVLRRAERVLILTGFPVLKSDGTACGETDGPLGAAEIAVLLAKGGCKVWLASDRLSFPLVCAAAAVYGEAAGVPVVRSKGEDGILLLELPGEETEQFAEEFLASEQIDLLIAIERPGRAADGHFYSMRGRVLDDFVVDTDCFLRKCSGHSVAIGDGGNELGMGKYREQILRQVLFGEKIAAELAAEYVLPAGVSNWWGAGLSALLAYETGCGQLLTGEAEESALRAAVSAGGVDGCSGRSALSVDGLELDFHLRRRELIWELLLCSVPAVKK